MLQGFSKKNIFLIKAGFGWDLLLKLYKTILTNAGFITLSLFFEKFLIEVLIKNFWQFFFKLSSKNIGSFFLNQVWGLLFFSLIQLFLLFFF